MPGREDLRKYQRKYAKKTAKAIHKRGGTYLAFEMALGKTVTTLTAVRNVVDGFMCRRVLIVAPKLVATHVWPQEIEAWEHTRVLKYRVLCGTAAQRQTALDEYLADKRIPIAIINRENLVWLWKAVGGLKGWPFDMLVYDEASRLSEGKKRSKSNRVNEFGVLATARAKLRYVILLSGTPIRNGHEDLWGQFYILDHGRRLGTRKSDFLSRWFESDYMGYNRWPRKGAVEQIEGRVKDAMISLRTTDVLKDLPGHDFSNVWVDLPPKLRKDYKRLVREMALVEHDVLAANMGVLTNKLLQFANGGLYRVDEDVHPPVRETIHLHDLKIDALAQMADEVPDENLLIAYQFHFDRDRIKERFGDVRLADEPGVIDEWNAGKVRKLLAHPAQIGHGLNLQFGGSRTIWFGLTPSYELYSQFNARLRRPGQKAPNCPVHHILARQTFDERALHLINGKGTTEAAFKSALAQYIKEAA